MTGPAGNSEFCFPSTSVFSEMKARGTVRSMGNKTLCFPWRQPLSVRNCLNKFGRDVSLNTSCAMQLEFSSVHYKNHPNFWQILKSNISITITPKGRAKPFTTILKFYSFRFSFVFFSFCLESIYRAKCLLYAKS